jgi:hypothetical protein
LAARQYARSVVKRRPRFALRHARKSFETATLFEELERLKAEVAELHSAPGNGGWNERGRPG